MEQLGLDRVLLVVANDPWLKAPTRGVTPAADRLAMTRAAVEGVEGIEVSSIEVDRGGPSYTIDTVEQLRAARDDRHPNPPELTLLVGADLVDQLDSWKRVDELRELVTLGVIARPGSPPPATIPGWRVRVVRGSGPDVSSSEIRDLLQRGEAVEGLVPPGVIRYIRCRNLYSVPR